VYKRQHMIDALGRNDRGSVDLKAYNKLLISLDREGRALSTLATKMRLSQQSTYDKTKRKASQSGAKPWEVQ